jgi:hypothetical protein
MANKDNNDYNHSGNDNQEQVSEEDEVDRQYEQERFNDTYSEDFRDDY